MYLTSPMYCSSGFQFEADAVQRCSCHQIVVAFGIWSISEESGTVYVKHNFLDKSFALERSWIPSVVVADGLYIQGNNSETSAKVMSSTHNAWEGFLLSSVTSNHFVTDTLRYPSPPRAAFARLNPIEMAAIKEYQDELGNSDKKAIENGRLTSPGSTPRKNGANIHALVDGSPPQRAVR